MIASIAFRNFKALRDAQVALRPFNLIIGSNGSGKSSLIEAVIRLRGLARLPLGTAQDSAKRREGMPEIWFRFLPPYEAWEASMSCVAEDRCDLLQMTMPAGATDADWTILKNKLLTMRSFEFNHQNIGKPAPLAEGTRLAADGANLAAVLATRKASTPEAFADWQRAVLTALPEYDEVGVESREGSDPSVFARLKGVKRPIPYYDLSQGTLYTLALFALGYDPTPPTVVCIEEMERGLHPRLLRQARDALYRLSHPQANGLDRAASQVIVTTHSPYLLDLFRDHPEEVIIADKQGQAAHFLRLEDRADLPELLKGVSLGDLWYSGILGGVPENTP